MTERKRNGDFERRAQSVVQIIITGLVAWVGFNVVDMGKSIVSLQVQAALAATTATASASQTAKDLASMKADGEALKIQVSTAALAANTAATAATTAAALAATAATTAAALAAQSPQSAPVKRKE